MVFLRLGLFLLLLFRVFHYVGRLRISAGEAVNVGADTGHVDITRDKYKAVRGVHLSVEVSDRFRFLLRPESALDRFAKRFGIAQEWQTGDESFDAKIFILSEDPALLETLSTDKELRSLIATVMDFHRGARLDCARGKLHLEVLVSDVDKEQSDEVLNEQFAREMLPALARLRARLERISAGDWRADRDPTLRRKAWLVGISTTIAALGILGLLVSIRYDRYQVVREAIPYYSAWITGCIGAALLAGIFLWLGRRPHTHAVLLDVILAALPGAWLASNAGLTLYNEEYDATAPAHYSVKVSSAYTSRHKSRTHYHLVVAQWPDARGIREVEVREGEYSLIYTGGCVGVLWHPGRLGDGWVSGYERANTENCGVMIE